MTTAVLSVNAQTSVLDGLSKAEICGGPGGGPYGFIPDVSLIPTSTVYFIPNISLTSSLKNVDHICVVGEAEGGEVPNCQIKSIYHAASLSVHLNEKHKDLEIQNLSYFCMLSTESDKPVRLYLEHARISVFSSRTQNTEEKGEVGNL